MIESSNSNCRYSRVVAMRPPGGQHTGGGIATSDDSIAAGAANVTLNQLSSWTTDARQGTPGAAVACQLREHTAGTEAGH